MSPTTKETGGERPKGEAVSSEAKRENVEHNTKQIAKYLEMAPSFIGPGPPPSEPMGKKYKGISRPPATEKAMAFWGEPCNRDAARLLGWRIAQLMGSQVRWRGVYFSTLITNLYEDPTSVPRWERKEAPDDRTRLAAFWKMCRLLAQSVAASDPNRQINVAMPKGAARASSRTQARDQGRRERRDEEHEDLARLVERVMEDRSVGTSEAVGIVADRNGVSTRKVYEAMAGNRTKNAS